MTDGNTTVSAVGNVLVLPSGASTTFAAPILAWVSFPAVVVVLLRPADAALDPQNVVGVGMDGRVLWRVPKRSFNNRHSPYIEIHRSANNVNLVNWEGVMLEVNPHSGEIIAQSWGK